MRPTPSLLNARNPLYVAAALDDADLSVYAFRIAGRIARRWSEERGCYESVNNMAEGCGINRKTAWAAIKELLERGIITEEKRPGQTTRYDFAPVDSWADPSRQTGQGHTTSRAVPSEGPSLDTVQAPVPPDGTPPVPPHGTQRDTKKGSKEGRGRVTRADSRPQGGSYGDRAVEIYHDVTGGWPAPYHADRIALRFRDASDDLLTAWGEEVTTYHVSDGRNADNIPGIIRTLDERLQRESQPPARPGAPRNASPRGAGLDERDRAAAGRADPEAEFRRVASEAYAAITGGPPVDPEP